MNTRENKVKESLAKFIRDIPDFPKPGILFRDITTLLKDKKAFRRAVDLMARPFKDKGIDSVVAIESRGFILGSAIAYKLGAGFIPVRKKGKLPGKTTSVTYDLEYGSDTLEMHSDSINPGDKILVIDDLIATGGTVKAVIDLLRKQRVKIEGIVFLIELTDLKGRSKLKDHKIHSLIKY